MEIEAVLIFVLLVLWLIGTGLKALFRLITGATRREREEQRRVEEADRRRKEEEQRKAAAERQIKIAAMKQFDEAVLDGQFPSDEVLAVLARCDGYLDNLFVTVKEALEELLCDTFIPDDVTYGEAVRFIRQWQRKEQRARQRAAEQPADDPNRPLTEADASALLGVAPGCTSEELAAAYRRKMFEWHPDRLESMAQELKDFATRRTARINEAYQKILKSAVEQNRVSSK